MTNGGYGGTVSECWNCQKRGHIAAICWAPGRGMDPRSQRKEVRRHRIQVLEVEESDEDDEEDEDEAENTSSVNILTEWVMVTMTEKAKEKQQRPS